MKESCGLTLCEIENRMLNAFEKGFLPTLLIADHRVSDNIIRHILGNKESADNNAVFLMTGVGPLQIFTNHSQERLDTTNVILSDDSGSYIDRIDGINPNVEFNAESP